MNRRAVFLRYAVLFPILCLALLILYRGGHRILGDTVTVPVTGYDPRDIFSGHYLTYRLDLGEDDPCVNSDPAIPVYLCIKEGIDDKVISERVVSRDERAGCITVLAGTCSGGSFTAGVERFYIPEGRSARFDKLVRERRASVVLSVDRDGHASVKDMLFEGKSWRDYPDDPGEINDSEGSSTSR